MGNNYGGNSEDRMNALFKEHGMVLSRQKKHRCYKHPDGRVFVVASTPSDGNWASVSLRELERFLGIVTIKGLAGQRRERKVAKGRIEKTSLNVNTSARAGSTLASALRSSDPARIIIMETCANFRKAADELIESSHIRLMNRISRIFCGTKVIHASAHTTNVERSGLK